MNTFKAEVNKIILALTSVGLLILLIFPASLSASHFQYATMSWSLDNSTTIRLKLQAGYVSTYDSFLETVGDTKTSSTWVVIDWGDGDSETVTFRTTSIDSLAVSSLVEIGVASGGTWESGVTHTYADNGTYVVVWTKNARVANIKNIPSSGSKYWRAETKVTIGGIHAGNVSPVSAVPPVIKVQDNTTDNFTYQVSATDANSSDNLHYRWGTYKEFIDNTSVATYSKPTGMRLSTTGYIEWDVRDSVLTTATNDIWSAFIMVEDNGSSGDNKSYIPIDFFFKVACATCAPPTFTDFPTGTQTVSVGSTKTFTIKSKDDGTAAPTISVMGPCSDNDSIWSTTSSNSMVGEDNITTFTINFAPNSPMGGTSCVVPIRSTDVDGMTNDKSLSIQISSVANADPTAPILLSPADGDNVSSPVTFRFAGSTDSDGDNVSYTMYVCGRSDFVGCSTGTSVTAGGNFVPPFNQDFHDNMIPWPSPLYAATASQQIPQDLSMIPKWFIMLVMLGLLSVIISLPVKNITHRRIVFVLFWLIIGMVSCSTSSSNEDGIDEDNTTSSTSDNTTSTSDNTTTSTDTTAPTVSSVSTTADNQSSVSTTDNIIVTFSEAMDTTYVITSTSDTNCAGTIMVSSSSDNFSTCVRMSSSPASSNSNKTFTLEPYGYLTVSTTYLTRVTTGVKDTAGNAMSSEYETSSGFTTDNTSTEPTVSSVSTTADNQSLVSITDNITVTFSEAMDTTYVTTNTSDTYCSGTIRVSSSSDNFSTGNCVKMSSAPASSNSNKTFTLDPYDNLTRLTTYLTRVTTGVKDTAGNAMGSQYETSSGFTTDNISTARLTVSNSGLTSGTTYYWKVVASDPKGGSAQSETWSFTVQ